MIKLAFEAAYFDENKVYYFAMEANLLCVYDIQKDESNILGSVPGYGAYEKRLCGDIIKFENCLYIIPFCLREIWVFDLDRKDWRDIPLENPNIKYKFWDSYVYKNKFYLIGHAYPGIVILDPCSDQLIERQIIDKQEEFYFGWNSVLIDNTLYLAQCDSSCVSIINLDTFEIINKSIEVAENGFEGLAYDGNVFWLLPRSEDKKNIIIWDGKDKFVQSDYYLKDALGIVSNHEGILCGTYDGKGSFVIDRKGFREINRDYYYIRRKGNYILIQDEQKVCVMLSDSNYKKKLNIGISEIDMKPFYKLAVNSLAFESEIISFCSWIESLMEKKE